MPRGGGYSGFQVTGMIEWIEKSRPKKISGPKIDPQKNPMPILWPLKVPERGNAITQRKTLEIEHSCLFIHHTIWIYPFPYLILFNTPKNPYSNQATQAKFSYPKKSRNRKFQTQKNPSIIPVTWNPEYPPWASMSLHGLYLLKMSIVSWCYTFFRQGVLHLTIIGTGVGPYCNIPNFDNLIQCFVQAMSIIGCLNQLSPNSNLVKLGHQALFKPQALVYSHAWCSISKEK